MSSLWTSSAPSPTRYYVHITGIAFLVVALALFVGAAIQGTIGFGMVVIAYPIILIVEPALVPQSTIVCALPTLAFMAWRHRGDSDWSEVGWFSLGRVPGYAGAVLILGYATREALTIVGGLTVLVAVALSLWAPGVARTPPTLAVGGLASAFFGASTGIGGPPVGLLYQNEQGERMRSTVSLQMLFGAPVSFGVLIASGHLDGTDIRTGIALLPFTLAGTYAARWVIPHFDDRLRPLILSTCGLAAIFALSRVALS